MEKDPFGLGRATYVFVRQTADGLPLSDGTCLLYANAQYRGDDEMGRLMSDFCESDPDRIRDELIRKRVQYLKRSPKGVEEMCGISEEIYNEGREEGKLEALRALMESLGLSMQEALECLRVPESERPRYMAMLRG